MLSFLEELFRSARSYLLRGGLTDTRVVGSNIKGQKTRGFDKRVEELIVERCASVTREPLLLWSEEGGEIQVGSGEPSYLLVLDPVDGSSNLFRGVEVVGFSAAVIPYGKERSLANVEYALAGCIYSGTVFVAQRRKGAWRNGVPIRGSRVREVRRALVGVDMGFSQGEKMVRIWKLLREANGIRSLGSAVTELVLVSSGALDAYVDVRDQLSAENFLAAGRVVLEAGGVVSDAYGGELPPVRSLAQSFNVVAAGNAVLHARLIEMLEMASLS